MDVTKIRTKLRLKFHLNMIKFYNMANQLHLVSDEKSRMKHKYHLKQSLDCYDRLGNKVAKVFKDLIND